MDCSKDLLEQVHNIQFHIIEQVNIIRGGGWASEGRPNCMPNPSTIGKHICAMYTPINPSFV